MHSHRHARRRLALVAIAVLVCLAAAQARCPAQQPQATAKDHKDKAKPLFNGRDLSGWKVIDQHDFARHGEVVVSEGRIVLSAGRPATGIVWTGKPPGGDYELSLQAARLEGDDFFCGLTFPVGDQFATLIIGGWGGGVTGLSNINGMSAVENETTGYIEFQKDRWYAIRLRVTADAIAAWVDDEMIVDVARQEKRFAVWWEQEPARPLGIVSWNTKAALRNIELRALSAP